MNLINNEAVDFIFAVKRFADRNKPAEHNYQSITELQSWCEEYEKKLSPFLLNDIALLVEKMILPSIYLFMLFKDHPKIQTGRDFLNLLETVPSDNFLKYFKYNLLDKPDGDITAEAIHEILANHGLHPGYDPTEESELLYGFLKDPSGFLTRLHKTYSDFYTLAYLPGLTKMKDLYQEKLDWHEQRLKDDGEKYLSLLGLQSFLKMLTKEGAPTLYFSFFSDNDVSSFWNSRTVVIGAGTDQRILHRSARDKADMFFSCFGDPKRLEILRLTAQRAWYSTELANHFDLKPATLSYHINILTDAELLHLIKGESRRFYYTLNKEKVREYLEYVAQDLLGLEHESKTNFPV